MNRAGAQLDLQPSQCLQVQVERLSVRQAHAVAVGVESGDF